MRLSTVRKVSLPALCILALSAGPAAAQGIPVRLGVTPNLTDAPPLLALELLEAHYTADFDPAMMDFLGKVLAQLRKESKTTETDAARLLDLRWMARAKGSP